MKLLLDTNLLGKICHPRKYQEVRTWLRRAAAVHDLLIPEIADYELRRELVRIGSKHSLARLDELTRELRYVPVTTATWREAAQLWAFLRRSGKATAPSHGLDGDLLLAVLALDEDAVVVTSNLKHLSQLVPAMDWPAVPLS